MAVQENRTKITNKFVHQRLVLYNMNKSHGAKYVGFLKMFERGKCQTRAIDERNEFSGGRNNPKATAERKNGNITNTVTCTLHHHNSAKKLCMYEG